MRDTIGKRQYKCKCGCIMEDYVWNSELSKHSLACFKCGTKLGVDNLKKKEAAQSAAIRTPTKNR